MMRRTAATLSLVLSLACGHVSSSPLRFAHDGERTIAGLGRCDDQRKLPLELDPARPLIVLVHGCNASAGRFRSLARVFEFHGQQALCFAYDDRARLRKSAGQLHAALDELSGQLGSRELTVLGHSQGGLVARMALARDQAEIDADIRLVTVSSPFNGIRAASDCGATWLHMATLGVTLGICRSVAGAKWNEIHPNAKPVVAPEPLAPRVREHLGIFTDERNTCRRKAADGVGCAEDDFVFSLAEQDNTRMRDDARLRTTEVQAGHAEIVGSDAREPLKLIRVLQEQQVMDETPPARKVALRALLERLF